MSTAASSLKIVKSFWRTPSRMSARTTAPMVFSKSGEFIASSRISIAHAGSLRAMER